jgi:ABC-type uncharacterized transport system substrate-binding protein
MIVVGCDPRPRGKWRCAAGDYTRLAGFASELTGMNLLVIVIYGTAAARVLQKTTSTIPIVVRKWHEV